MAPICRAIEHKVRWSHHVVLSETRGGSVATWVSNSNTERVDYQQYAFVDSKRSGSSLGWYVRYAWYLTTDMPCVKQSNMMPMDVYSWSWLKNHQIQVIAIYSVLPRPFSKGGTPCRVLMTPCLFQEAEMTQCLFWVTPNDALLQFLFCPERHSPR